MNHLEFARTESASLDHDRAWINWATRAEDMLGHCLDGDQQADGYSLDGALVAYREGSSVVEYVLGVKAATSERSAA